MGTRATWLLAFTWLIALGINTALVVHLWFLQWIDDGTLRLALTYISTLYAPYIGPILLFTYAGRRMPRAHGASWYIAMASSVGWNLVIVFLFLRVWLGQGKIEDSIDSSREIASVFSWLVAPAIAAYFGMRAVPATDAARK